ncbi:MAG: SDR family oxidoreductase [Candidatus Obscuribacterales bacterium]|nr:SDR family oxidoreductase [Candidatus Obscuribacterales bacterium]
MKKEFAGVITGASSGIGKALAIYLARKYRARLVISGRNEEQLKATKEQVEKAGGLATIVVADIGEEGAAKRLVNTCLEQFGSIELLVNNAGMAYPGRVLNLTMEDWRRVFDVNYFACVEAIYAALPHFLEQGGGKIVNVSSVAGKIPIAGSVMYSSSKHALNSMSVAMGAELNSKNIDFLTVCPGWVRTEFFEKNQVADEKNPTLIASKNTPSGLLMRLVLSISAEDVAREIDSYLRKGGSHEIIMTAPGKFFERLNGLLPGVVWNINKLLPTDYVDSSIKDKVKT